MPNLAENQRKPVCRHPDAGGAADRFRFGSLTEASSGADRIGDFSTAQGDKIDLTAIDAITGGGDDAFTFIATQGFHNVAGELRYSSGGGGFLVQGDVNGDGVADFTITVVGAPTLQATDFML